jgi:hypothetical protein
MPVDDGPKEASKTYIEQTKLLVTLASAFVVAPVAIVPWLAGSGRIPSVSSAMGVLLWAESSFIVSVLAGYVVLATIAGFQQQNIFDVNRRATRLFSIIQIGAYLLGLGVFVSFVRSL